MPSGAGHEKSCEPGCGRSWNAAWQTSGAAYLATDKRAAWREVAIETLQAGSEGSGEFLASRSPSPSHHAAQSELTQALDRALVRLPEHYRQAVAWRHQEHLSWDEIGLRMDCTADAVRKVWSRAIQQLRQDLAGHALMP